MTVPAGVGAPVDRPPAPIDLRRASLATVRSIDFRAPDRTLVADEAAIWDRLQATLAGLDDAAWRLPGAAPSDAGGPDWSLAEHVGHLADWQQIAVDYVGRVLDGDPWPTDDDFEGGDFDLFNEARRERWQSLPPPAVRRRLAESRDRLLTLVRRLTSDTIRSDLAWGWVYMVLHGHQLDHLGVLEPWATSLRRRQAEGDPFLADPRPAGDGSPASIAAFWAAEASVFDQFDALVRPVSPERWAEPGPTPDWSLADHVAHLARWFEEGARAIEHHRASGAWDSGPAEGIDAWNAREVALLRGIGPAEALRRFDAGRARLRAIAAGMAPEELASAEGGYWTYDCLHGHVRAHLAMIGPWVVRAAWPEEEPDLPAAGPATGPATGPTSPH